MKGGAWEKRGCLGVYVKKNAFSRFSVSLFDHFWPGLWSLFVLVGVGWFGEELSVGQEEGEERDQGEYCG
jgi:hypothetical protein